MRKNFVHSQKFSLAYGERRSIPTGRYLVAELSVVARNSMWNHAQIEKARELKGTLKPGPKKCKNKRGCLRRFLCGAGRTCKRARHHRLPLCGRLVLTAPDETGSGAREPTLTRKSSGTRRCHQHRGAPLTQNTESVLLCLKLHVFYLSLQFSNSNLVTPAFPLGPRAAPNHRQ